MKRSITFANKSRYTIIDEADEMVSADWVDEMQKIMGGGGTVIRLAKDSINVLKGSQIPM